MNCFIEFLISDDDKFKDLEATFDLFKQAKNNNQPEDDQFWLDNFPDYALEKFHFIDTDIRPTFKTPDPSDYTWHFYSLIELMQTNYEIIYIDMYSTSLANHGKLEFDPYSYPYGGVDGLLTFIRVFDCAPTLIDDGTETYVPKFRHDNPLYHTIVRASVKPQRKFSFWNFFRRSK